MRHMLSLCVLLAVMLAGCGGGGGSSAPIVAGVAVSPSSVSLTPGATQQFSADMNVDWSIQEGATGGSINNSGVYVAPVTPGTYHIVASLKSDSAITAAVAVEVLGEYAKTRIAFDSDIDGNKNIYTIHPDGSGMVRLTENTANDYDPDFSPDGSKIVFTSNRDGSTALYIMNSNGSGVTRLTTGREATFSPDGMRVVFIDDVSGKSEVFTVNADGSGRTQWTAGGHVCRTPAFTLDGDVVFDMTTTIRRGLYRMSEPEGSINQVWETSISSRGYRLHPSYSPNGALVYESMIDSYSGNSYQSATEIAVDSGGHLYTRLTYNEGIHDRAPDFSSGGDWIAYASQNQIRLMPYRENGNGQPIPMQSTQLTHSGRNDNPSWGPES
jgi:Tol biopolymer transport system component